MTEDTIKNLLQKTDETAGAPAPVSINLSAVRRRANRKRIMSIATPIAVAAVILAAFSLWAFTSKTIETKQQQKIASLEAQIQHLQARADATLDLVKEVIENERKQRQLNELQAQLASISDPIAEIQKQVDKTAFILIYQADRMYRELNLTDSAIQTYKRVIELFSETQWAEVARQRLSEIQTYPKRGRRDSSYKKDSIHALQSPQILAKQERGQSSKGGLLWKLRNVPSSC